MEGFHHVSLITKNRELNQKFYEKILGLRLVKKTYHQENKHTPHLFYGDYLGSAGSLFSFFEFPMVGQSYWGKNRIAEIALLVPSTQALEFWHQRLQDYDIKVGEIEHHFDRMSFRFEDFDNSQLRMVTAFGERRESKTQRNLEIPLEYQILGIGPIDLHVSKLSESIDFLQKIFNMKLIGMHEHSRIAGKYCYVLENEAGARYHLEDASDLSEQRDGRGSVDHVAMTVNDVFEWEKRLDELGVAHSGVIDRYYFKSIYVEDPSGINFELSNESPGFLVDEDLDNLGSSFQKL